MRALLQMVPWTVFAAGLGSCTAAKLEPVPPPAEGRADNKLAIEGSFCTTDPDNLAFPVKLLFILDTSSSMDATDPSGQRVEALVSVIDAVQGIPGVEIAIMIFGLGAQVLTEHCDDYAARTNCKQGFAPPAEALQVVAGAGQAAGTTDFVITLQSALALLADDMGSGDALTLQNSRYDVIFLSDGLPDADGTFDATQVCEDAATWETTGRAPDNADVVTEVGDLMRQIGELANQYDVRQMTFNTAFAAAPQTTTPIKACGSTFMRAMAKQGQGVFRDFSSGEEINFLFVDFTSFKRIFSMKNFTVMNLNAQPFSSAIGVDVRTLSDDPTLNTRIIDSDGDGVTDYEEDLIGTDSRQQDTDLDGFGDLIEHRLKLSGFDPLDHTDADCVTNLDRLDTDGDGLRDCEERFFGTNTKTYDSDLDGFGDGIEVLYGTNPGLADTLLDVDFDGVRNAGEMRAHSRVDTDDVVDLSEHAYRYRVTEDGIEGSSLCYSFRVENIALSSTHGADDTPPDAAGNFPAPGLGGGAMAEAENRILIEVTEQPFDAPNQAGVPRLACARARFNAAQRLKDPANGVVQLPRDAFKPATEFNPITDCVKP